MNIVAEYGVNTHKKNVVPWKRNAYKNWTKDESYQPRNFDLNDSKRTKFNYNLLDIQWWKWVKLSFERNSVWLLTLNS